MISLILSFIFLFLFWLSDGLHLDDLDIVSLSYVILSHCLEMRHLAQEICRIAQ